MIKYLENRVWSLNAKIVNTEADPAEINRLLAEKLTSGIFAGEGIRFSYSENPIGNYSFRPVEVTLEMTAKAIGQYQQFLDEKGISFRISSFRMIINAFGFLNIIPVFEYACKPGNNSYAEIEKNGDASAEIIDAIFSDISAAIDVLDSAGIIRKSSYYHFGVPSGLEKSGIHTREDSYNYLVHIFYFGEKELLDDTVKQFNSEENVLTFEEHSLFSEFPIYFWEMKHDVADNELVDLISINSYMLCETVAVNNALHVYNSFLDILNQNLEVDSNHLREIFNFNTWLIQNLRLFNPNFTLYQSKFMKMYRQNSDISPKYDLLKDAEQSLTFAIEGIEVTRTQQSERIMQFILALFTALTLYSVITDAYALITSEVQAVPFSMHSTQTIIFILETTVVLAFIIFFRKISRRI